MKFIENQFFDEYIDSYKKLPIKEKKEILEKEIKELLVILSTLNDEYGVDNNNTKILFNREILDLNKKESTEADFVEAIFVYLYSIKELLASLLENIRK